MNKNTELEVLLARAGEISDNLEVVSKNIETTKILLDNLAAQIYMLKELAEVGKNGGTLQQMQEEV